MIQVESVNSMLRTIRIRTNYEFYYSTLLVNGNKGFKQSSAAFGNIDPTERLIYANLAKMIAASDICKEFSFPFPAVYVSPRTAAQIWRAVVVTGNMDVEIQQFFAYLIYCAYTYPMNIQETDVNVFEDFFLGPYPEIRIHSPQFVNIGRSVRELLDLEFRILSEEVLCLEITNSHKIKLFFQE